MITEDSESLDDDDDDDGRDPQDPRQHTAVTVNTGQLDTAGPPPPSSTADSCHGTSHLLTVLRR